MPHVHDEAARGSGSRRTGTRESRASVLTVRGRSRPSTESGEAPGWQGPTKV